MYGRIVVTCVTHVTHVTQDGKLVAESEPFQGPQQAARRASITCRSADTDGVIADFELLDGLVSVTKH
jgi:hypothetical protein